MSPLNHSTVILLGMAYLLDENADSAKEMFAQALRLEPQHPASHHLLGSALVLGHDYAAAVASFEHSLSLEPGQHEALNGLGTAYDGMGDYARAASAFEAALTLQPDTPIYRVNLGLNMARQGNPLAIPFLDRAIGLSPTNAKAHIVLAESLLAFGDYKRGFAEYEWRWRSPSFSKPHRQYDAPLWDGSSLVGKTILLHAEQGLGDTIQFVLFLPQVASRGGRVILVVQQQLFSLFESLRCIGLCLPGTADRLPPFDVHCPLLSLPLLLGTQLETIPAPLDLNGIVVASAPRQSNAPLRVGLVWRGNPKHQRDPLRSLALASLLPLRDVIGCTFFNFQKDMSDVDQAPFRAFEMECFPDECRDFLDTANAIQALDLLICVDTSVAHLAATLGKNVWLILPEAADWRWGSTGERTPWYPTIKLFRKQAGQPIEHLVGRLIAALEQTIHV